MRITFALLLLTSLSGIAQQYNFKHFNEIELKSDFFYDIDQNSQGELYIASSKGLLIYNGIGFQQLTDRDSLIDEFISNIYIDRKDHVWIAYYKGGLSKIENGTISHYCSDCYVEEIFELREHETVITTDQNAFKIVGNKMAPISEYQNLKTVQNLPENKQIHLTKDNRLLFIDDPNTSQLILDSVDLFSCANNNYPLTVKRKNILFVYNEGVQGLPKLEMTMTVEELGIHSDITTILMRSKKVVIGTESEGLYEIYLNPGYQSYSIQHFSKKNGLGIEKVNCLFVDNERNLWVGSYGDGITVLPKKRTSIHALTNDNRKNKILDIEYHRGELYIASENSLRFMKKDADNRKFQLFENRTITDLHSYGDTLWIGTSMGLYFMNEKGIQKFKFESLREKPGYINKIQCHDGSVYLGTNTGLFIHNLKTNESLKITTNDGLAHNVVENFIIDDSRTFWFDSPNSPFYSYQDGEFEYYKNVDGFESFNITDIRQVANGEIWFGTAGDGIFVYNDGNFKQISSDQKLFDNYIYFLEESRDGKVIAGHKSGISIIQNNKDQVSITDLGVINDLEYIIQNSSYLSASDYLWVGTSYGAARIPRISEFDKKFIPPLSINSVSINQIVYSADSIINLPYDNYYVEINFGAVYLSNASSIKYKYILEGFDKDWSTIGYNENVARYQSLLDGEYTFRVKLILDNRELDNEQVFSFTVEKPYWKKTSFYIWMGVLVIVLFFISLWIANRRNRRIRVKLTKEVKERTTDLVKKNSEITSINHELEAISEQYLQAKNTAEYKAGQIEESITYAKHIQKALLRKKEYVEWMSAFSEFFLIFKPKDVVSGDFYWGAKKDDFAYVAVADCTGHGVPGAMISMLGASFLNDAIVHHNETHDLLNILRTKVIDGFNQTENSTLSDGMDICVMRLNTKNLEGQFSGAMNPIFIIRKKSEGEIDGLKLAYSNDTLNLFTTSPDKQPIGFYHHMSEFTSTNFQFKKDDRVYLLSDGYVDQFGGPNYKKFMRKNLWDILLEIHDLSDQEQKKILWDRMADWIGDQEQIDDISIIGLKI